MKTSVQMRRGLFDSEVRQRTSDEYFCISDLVVIGNDWRKKEGLSSFNLSQWLKLKGVSEFIEALKRDTGKEVVYLGRGRSSVSWVHPYIFIDAALAINPKLKIKVYKWLYDYLIQKRNDSGDSYKLMSGALYEIYPNKKMFPAYMKTQARKIREALGVEDWQKATERQLADRDKIHHAIFNLSSVFKNHERIVGVAIDQVQNYREKVK